MVVVVRPCAVICSVKLWCDCHGCMYCMWAGSGWVLEHNVKLNRIPVTADKCLSVPCALILTVYLICLSLSPSFFQSAALWCTSVAMNSSPSPAPEQIRVPHQMWVQKCLLSPLLLLPLLSFLSLCLSSSICVCLSLNPTWENRERRWAKFVILWQI